MKTNVAIKLMATSSPEVLVVGSEGSGRSMLLDSFNKEWASLHSKCCNPISSVHYIYTDHPGLDDKSFFLGFVIEHDSLFMRHWSDYVLDCMVSAKVLYTERGKYKYNVSALSDVLTESIAAIRFHSFSSPKMLKYKLILKESDRIKIRNLFDFDREIMNDFVKTFGLYNTDKGIGFLCKEFVKCDFIKDAIYNSYPVVLGAYHRTRSELIANLEDAFGSDYSYEELCGMHLLKIETMNDSQRDILSKMLSLDNPFGCLVDGCIRIVVKADSSLKLGEFHPKYKIKDENGMRSVHTMHFYDCPAIENIAGTIATNVDIVDRGSVYSNYLKSLYHAWGSSRIVYVADVCRPRSARVATSILTEAINGSAKFESVDVVVNKVDSFILQECVCEDNSFEYAVYKLREFRDEIVEYINSESNNRVEVLSCLAGWRVPSNMVGEYNVRPHKSHFDVLKNIVEYHSVREVCKTRFDISSISAHGGLMCSIKADALSKSSPSLSTLRQSVFKGCDVRWEVAADFSIIG